MYFSVHFHCLQFWLVPLNSKLHPSRTEDSVVHTSTLCPCSLTYSPYYDCMCRTKRNSFILHLKSNICTLCIKMSISQKLSKPFHDLKKLCSVKRYSVPVSMYRTHFDPRLSYLIKVDLRNWYLGVCFFICGYFNVLWLLFTDMNLGCTNFKVVIQKQFLTNYKPKVIHNHI